MKTATDTAPTHDDPAITPQSDGGTVGRQRLGRLGRDALHKQLRHMSDSVAVVREVSGVEDIHQMRVATRRLRTVAQLLEETPAFRRKHTERLRDQLRPLATHLGAVRDLDMLLASLTGFERSVVETDQTSTALRDELLWRREKALHHLRRELQQPIVRKLLAHPRRKAKRLVRRSRAVRKVLVRHVAGDVIWRRYEAVLSFEEIVAGFPATEQLHALRITCKKLRYALEVFSAEDDPCAQSLIETLKRVQDHLGDLQDSVFAVGLLTQLRHDYPHNHVLEGFRASLEMRRNTLRQDFSPLWETISDARYRQDLASFIAAL